jgi:DNA primase
MSRNAGTWPYETQTARKYTWSVSGIDKGGCEPASERQTQLLSPEEIQAAKRKSLLPLLPPGLVLHKKGENRYMALCVFHDETTPSMSLQKYPDGCWGYKCFGCGATGDTVKYVEKTKGMDFVDAVRFLHKEAQTAPLRPTIEATYDYQDSAGKLLYQVVRYKPKGFRVRQPTGSGWSWCLDGLKRTLYKLPELLLNHDKTIYYVEGEKDVETLRNLSRMATTHAGGVNAWKAGLLDCLPGKRKFMVVPDRDEPGMVLMRKVFAAARERGHDVGFVLLPKHKDITEWVEAGNDLSILDKA